MKKIVAPINTHNFEIINKYDNIDSVYFGYRGYSARDSSYDLDDDDILKIQKKKFVAFNAYKDPDASIIERICALGVEGIITTSNDPDFLHKCKTNGLKICLSVNYGLINIWMLENVLISENYDIIVVPSHLENEVLKYIKDFPQVDFEFISIGARCPFITFFCSCNLEFANSFCVNGRVVFRRMNDFSLNDSFISKVKLMDNVVFKIEGRYDTESILEKKIEILNEALFEDN